MSRKSLVPIEVPDDAYNASSWNGSAEVPTKNAVRDKIESLGAGASPIALDVRAYGAVPDAKRITNVVASSGDATVTSSGADFGAGDIGKSVFIYDHANGVYVFQGTISSINSATSIELSGNAAASVTSGNGIMYYGTDNATDIQSALTAAAAIADDTAIDANQPLGGGKVRVLFPTDSDGERYMFDTTLAVGANVDIDADAMLISNVGTAGAANRTWAIDAEEGANFTKLGMDCCYGMGITVGTAAQNAQTYIGDLRLWSVGTNYDGGASPNAQIGLHLTGYDFFINRYWIKGGNIGLHLDNASDVAANSVFLIGCSTGLQLTSSEQVNFTNVLLDTCSYTGIAVDGSRNVNMQAQMFQINATAATFGLLIGEYDATNKNRNLNIKFQAQRTGTANGVIKISNALDSTIQAIATNEAIFSAGGTAISGNAVVYGSGNAGSLDVTVNRDAGITLTSGTRTGILRDVSDGTETLYGSLALNTPLPVASGGTGAGSAAAAFAALKQAASTTATGVAELATAAETTTGTDTARVVTPAGLAGSDYGKRIVGVLVSDPGGDALTTGDGKAVFRVPSAMNGYNLVAVAGNVSTVSSSGIPTVQLRRSRRTNATTRSDADMLSTKLTIDASEFDSVDAASAAVINASNDDVNTGDHIYIDVDVAGTGAKGLFVELQFQKP